MLIDDIKKIEKRFDKDMQKLKTVDKSVVLFGAGSTSVFILHQFRENGIFPICFCDNDRKKAGQKIEDLPVISFQDLQKQQKTSVVYITTQLFYREIKKQLLEASFTEEQIIGSDLIYQFEWEKKAFAYYEENASEIERLYLKLGDEKSRKVLFNRLAFLYSRDRSYMTELHDKVQYFDRGILKLCSVDKYVDLGTYTGDSIEEFISYTDSRYVHIWGFEPDPSFYKIAAANLENYSNITLVPKATSNRDEKRKVNSSLGEMQTIDNAYLDNTEEGQEFDVCKLDTFFSETRLNNSMIKMDIEGAELSTLEGMEEIIIKYRPVLLVCVYHKLEDILTIPQYLEGIAPGYHFFLRHYSDNQTETVLFALP